MKVRFTNGELVFLGPVDHVLRERFPDWCRPLPLLNLRQLEDRPREHATGRRSRSPITMPGHRKGCPPANKGKTFPPEPLTPDEALRLLDACGASRIGTRNRALFAVLWRAGLRISEALALRPHNVDFDGRRITVMRGKGGKRRTVGIDVGGLAEVQKWMVVRATLDLPAGATLFCTVSRPTPGGPLGSAYVRERMRELGAKAGIPKRVHPHGMRHSLACDLARERHPLPHIQSQLGHSSPGTTGVYLRGMGADEAFEAVAAREWPAASPSPESPEVSP